MSDVDDDAPLSVSQTAIIDTRGHGGRTAPFARSEMEYGQDFDTKIASERLFWRVSENETPEQREKLHRLFFNAHQCYVCAEHYGFHCSEDGERYTASTECPYPGGIPTFDVLLNIASGKIVFANDMRSLVVIKEPRVSVNYMAGQRLLTEAYAAAGLVVIATGNTCPGIWQQADQSIAIANYRGPADADEDFDPDEFEKLGVVTPVSERGKRMGSICTDLWDYCAMDHDRFIESCTSLGIDPSEFDTTVVDVDPGIYAFTVEKDTGRDTATEVYSRIAKTDREAPAIITVDTGLATRLEDSHAYETVNEMLRISSNRWGAVEFLLTVTGNGFDWVDGFYRDGGRRVDKPFRKMSVEDPDTHPLTEEVPLMAYRVKVEKIGGGRTAPSYIYPMSRNYCGLLTVPESADPWWLALCLILSKALIAHPVVFDPKRNPEEALHLARQALVYHLEIVERRGGIEFIRPYLNAWAAIDMTGMSSS